MKKVFLGGTKDSAWRDSLIKDLKIDYFNPIVEDWTYECRQEELIQRKECDYALYVITPLMTGVYSIAEAVDDSNKQPEKTVFCYVKHDKDKDFLDSQIRSLDHVGRMIEGNGGTFFTNLDADKLFNVIEYLNK